MQTIANSAVSPGPTSDSIKRVGLVSLGCAKNLVDSEIMLGSILGRGMQIVSDAAQADVVIVNTCGFIDSAKEESIEAILQAHQERGLGKHEHQRLVVAGCMSQRFASELKSSLPEVDAFMGLDQVAEAGEIVERVLSSPPNRNGNGDVLDFVTKQSRFIPDHDTPRFRLTPSHSSYIKIAEGCNHPCTFCVIPRMRGRHRSRTIESVTEEVRRMVGEGVREFNLISQDTTYFGMDLWQEKAGPRALVDSSRGPTLTRLLESLETIDGDFWIRLLYTHPAHWSSELMQCIANTRKVARYVDMPLQHIHPQMLDRMQRETSAERIRNIISEMRATIPGLAIRTTFIVGFPGETDEHFDCLAEFVSDTRFERLGVFTYSQEDGSRAAKFDEQVPVKIRRARQRSLMLLQQSVAKANASAQIGSVRRVLMDTPAVGRTEADAPDVDCRVYLETPTIAGEFADVLITGTRDYDLEGQINR